MLCLLRSHGMFRYTDETPVSSQPSIYGKEKVGGHQWLWTKSNDTVIKGWILGSLSQEPLRYVLNSLTEKRDESNRCDQHNERDDQPADSDFSAKDVWDELQTIYGPSSKQSLFFANISLF